jgi:hypothetical protein
MKKNQNQPANAAEGAHERIRTLIAEGERR